MDLELSSFEKAVRQLSAGLVQATAEPGNELARDGAIQRFGYTYELSHKMLRRYLEASEPDRVVIRELSFPSLVRLGWARGLLNESWDRWTDYRDARGTTSHTYNSEKAAAVFAKIPDFLRDATYLLAQLKMRTEGS